VSVHAEVMLDAMTANATMNETNGDLKALLTYVAEPPARGYLVTSSA
jgi:hypothetical protein